MGAYQGFTTGEAGRSRVSAKNNRLFLEAVLWIARTGAPWRDLPESFGHWHRVYVRYNRWSHKGVWERVFAAVIDDPDLEYLMVDGRIVRVHQHGAAKKTNKPAKRKVDRGVGGVPRYLRLWMRWAILFACLLRKVRQMRLLRGFRLTLLWRQGL